jgi:hypothetical protein
MCPSSWDDDLATPSDCDEDFFPHTDDSTGFESQHEKQAKLFALKLIGESGPDDLVETTKIKFETPFYPNEIESRTVLVSNLPSETTMDDFLKAISSFGDVESVSTEKIGRGLASVKFYDLRDAYRLRASSMSVHGRTSLVAFGPTETVSETGSSVNTGTIIVFNVGLGVTDEVIEKVFEVFGNVREIRRSPGKDRQRFIEFWDKRNANEALTRLQGQFVRELKGKLSIDFSRPGGFRAKVKQLSRNRLPTIERCCHESKLELFGEARQAMCFEMTGC